MDTFEFENPVMAMGFAQIPHAMTLDTTLTDGAYRTYAIYLRYAHQKNVCWPGRERMARDRGLSVSTISRHNAELVQLGYILRHENPDGSWRTVILDLNNNPRLQQIATANRTNERGVSQKCDIPRRKNATQKNNNEEEEQEQQRVADAEPGDGFEYVPAGDEFARAELKIVQFLNNDLGWRGRFTEGQKKKLRNQVFNPDGPSWNSPEWLFQNDPHFPDFLRAKVDWADGTLDGEKKKTGSLVSVIVRYGNPGTGWLDFKAERMQQATKGLSARSPGSSQKGDDDYAEQIRHLW